MISIRTPAWRIVLVSLLLASGTHAYALNPALDISQYAHTSWKIRDGFTRGYIRTIAQTPDGYLWFGTEFGLLRFDGVRIVEWQPPGGQALPSNEIVKLLAARDGSLWIGTDRGLVRWTGGAVTVIPEFSGLFISGIAEDRAGAVWARSIGVASGKVCSVTPAPAHCESRFGDVLVGLYEDRRGALWTAVPNGVWRLKPGRPVLYQVPGALDSIQMLLDDERGLLMVSRRGVRRLIDGRIETYAPAARAQSYRTSRLLRDRDGGLWIATAGHGLVHIHDGRSDEFSLADGLSGDNVFALFEDREGSVWVSTASGLDRFRDFAIPTLGVRQGVPARSVSTVLAAGDGSLFFGTMSGVFRTNPNALSGPPSLLQRGRQSDGPANSLFEDRAGRLWVSTIDGIGYSDGDRYVPKRDVRFESVVRAMTGGPDGTLWIANLREGLLQLPASGVPQRIPWKQLGRTDSAAALLAADDGGLWIGFQEGGLISFRDGRVAERYEDGKELASGRVNHLRLDRQGALWIAADGGVSRLAGGRLSTWRTAGGLPCDRVQWTMEDDDGSLWIYASCGLTRMTLADLSEWASGRERSPRTPGRPRVFDTSDGVNVIHSTGYSPQVSKSSDGKIWFLSAEGISVIDPARLAANVVPPPVHIEGLRADRQDYAIGAGRVALPALSRHLEIDYTALSLVASEKVRFKYRLEGSEAEWQDVGARRQAFYDNLAPGSYRFRVIASNNDGVWNEEGASIAFVIAPAYYQARWFLPLVVGLVTMLVFAAHRLRLRVVKRHEREISALNQRLMSAQEQERMRIAGELHDGVMQEMLAVTMMLGTAKRGVPADSKVKATLEKAQEKLVEVGTDLRQLSHDLHPKLLRDMGLPEALRTYGEQFKSTHGIELTCEVDAALQELSRGSALALFRIIQESLGNAVKHASARHVSVSLTRDRDWVRLIVSDDGSGFDGSRLEVSAGLGLITMRERATQLHGTFDLDTAPGRGTTITVTIPFR